jgi:hypothetical protein
MSPDEKLAAILAAVQTDPGNRGLARDPHDNLFTACPGDFTAACRSIAGHPDPSVAIVTGFFIPTAEPPANETDGPLGAVFLYRALKPFGIFTGFVTEQNCFPAFDAGLNLIGDRDERFSSPKTVCRSGRLSGRYNGRQVRFSHLIAVERVGPAGNGRCHTMRGIDITDRMEPAHELFDPSFEPDAPRVTIGIGDGGNEIGMGKIPHETVVKNIPNGDLIHCRVPADHLIVAGVSNWGAYALAAGVYVLRGATPPADLFDPAREREILGAMVRGGPLVDGVTGQQTATVDGLAWDDYVRPLVRIRAILEA